MSDLIKAGMMAVVSNPVLCVFIAWVCGIITGILIGRSFKTRAFEIERDKAQADLAAIKRTIEIFERVEP